MATYLRCIASFPHSSGLPEHTAVNTFALIGAETGTRTTHASAFTTALNAFYGAIKANLSSQWSWNSGTYEYLDMEDARPRVPFQTDSAALGTLSTANSDGPPEVALCLSFRGSTGSGLNAKRRRGRIYIGPLQIAGTDTWSPANATADTIATAAAALRDTVGFDWAVYSRYTHHAVPVGEDIKDYPDEVPSLLDDAFIPVTTVWVDNAFDTQRRRGLPATYRKTL